MVVFDITRRESFDDVKVWNTEIQNNAEEDIVIYLIGNMADLEENREVSASEAEALCK